MSFPDILAGQFLSISVEDPDNAGTYIVVCGLNSYTFTPQINTRDRAIRDCAQPESLPVRKIIGTSKQWDFSGSGLMNRAQYVLLNGLLGDVINWRFNIGEPTDDPVYTGYWAGAGMLTTLPITGGDGADVEINLTVASDGVWTLTTL